MRRFVRRRLERVDHEPWVTLSPMVRCAPGQGSSISPSRLNSGRRTSVWAPGHTQRLDDEQVADGPFKHDVVRVQNGAGGPLPRATASRSPGRGGLSCVRRWLNGDPVRENVLHRNSDRACPSRMRCSVRSTTTTGSTSISSLRTPARPSVGSGREPHDRPTRVLPEDGRC